MSADAIRTVAMNIAALGELVRGLRGDTDTAGTIADLLEEAAADLAHEAEQLEPTEGGSVWDRNRTPLSRSEAAALAFIGAVIDEVGS